MPGQVLDVGEYKLVVTNFLQIHDQATAYALYVRPNGKLESNTSMLLFFPAYYWGD